MEQRNNRSIRVSGTTAENLENLGTMGDTYDSIISKLIRYGSKFVQDFIPMVEDNRDITEIFELMRLYSFNGDPENSFLLHLIPMDLPYQSFEVINSFRTVLYGCFDLPRSKDNKLPHATVLELVVPEGKTKSHGYIITPLNHEGWWSTSGVALHSYVFLNSFTSGYSGTGPQIQRIVQEELDKNKSSIKHVVKTVHSMRSLNGLFYEMGPILDINFPNFEMHIRGFEFDTRFTKEVEE